MSFFSRDRSRTTAEVAASLQAPARSITLTKGSGPAVSSERVSTLASGNVDFVKKFNAAGDALAMVDMVGIRAQAVFILDHSGSMSHDYREGNVQTLVERALAFSLQIDIDGTIPVIPFDSVLHPTVDVNPLNYQGVVDREIFQPYRMGGTLLAPALNKVWHMATETREPLFVVIVTDDDPQDRAEVKAELARLRRYPVFVKVLTLVDAPFWEAMNSRVVPGTIDNLNAQRVKQPERMSDRAFADVMVAEWDSWVALAQSAGILR